MKVYIDKNICKFLFIHDLSGWHYSSRKSFRDYWIRTPYKLSNKERTALIAWRKLNVDFYKKKNKFILNDHQSLRLSKAERNIVDSAFKILESRFEFHYKQQIPNMKKIVKYLSEFKTFPYLREVYRLYGIKESKMPVYIAMSHSANKSAGGMQLGNMVILQFGDFKLGKDNSPMLNVLFHELTHNGTVSKFLPTNMKIKLPRGFTGDSKDFVDEVIHKALWSEIGLFSQKQFKWSNRRVENVYKLLVNELGSPYKEMIKKAFLAREYLRKRLDDEPKFRFDRSSVKELVDLIS